jgi:hypothetical protein
MRTRLMAFAASAAVLGTMGYAVLHEPPLEQPCPASSRSAPATAVHLAPSLIQHQNWVALPSTDVDPSDSWIYACTDGVVVGLTKTNHVDVDPSTGLAQVKIATRWVDLAWLSGDLDVYRDPARWKFVYTQTD